jgi:hypothetical protein
VSKVSSKAEHLIRAALKGIEKNPESWNQDNWVETPEDRERAGLQPSACGTAYCLGGWMMLYDGWKHEARKTMYSRHLRNFWIKDDVETDDPYRGFLKGLVYGDDATIYFEDTIFVDHLDMDDILARIDEDLEINFEEDCPCLTEADVCNLQGCPCGTHTTALEFPASAFTSSREAINRIIEKFALDCRKVGDMITVEQVLADKVLMDAFAAMHCAGEDSMVHTVTQKANRRINELRVRLEGEIREITQSRDRLVARNSELQQSASSRFPYTTAMIRHNEEREQVIRKLQGQVDELRAGTRSSPEFVKLKAKVKRLQESLPAMALNIKDLQNRLDGARNELAAQKRANVQVQTIGRQEGFQRAVAAWQKALDIVKKEEGL